MSTDDLVVYRECRSVFETRYDPSSGQTPTEAVLDALSEAEGIDVLGLPPLYEAVDTDGLNRLLDRGQDESNRTILGFEVGDWNVFVRGDGRILVCDSTQPTEPTPVFAE